MNVSASQKFPVEIWHRIAEECSPVDRIHLASSNRQMRNAVAAMPLRTNHVTSMLMVAPYNLGRSSADQFLQALERRAEATGKTVQRPFLEHYCEKAHVAAEQERNRRSSFLRKERIYLPRNPATGVYPTEMALVTMEIASIFSGIGSIGAGAQKSSHFMFGILDLVQMTALQCSLRSAGSHTRFPLAFTGALGGSIFSFFLAAFVERFEDYTGPIAFGLAFSAYLRVKIISNLREQVNSIFKYEHRNGIRWLQVLPSEPYREYSYKAGYGLIFPWLRLDQTTCFRFESDLKLEELRATNPGLCQRVERTSVCIALREFCPDIFNQEPLTKVQHLMALWQHPHVLANSYDFNS